MQVRLKALGEVKLEDKRVIQLADGREQIEAVYSFKTPIKSILQFTPEYESWRRIYRETVTLQCDTTGNMPPQALCAFGER